VGGWGGGEGRIGEAGGLCGRTRGSGRVRGLKDRRKICRAASGAGDGRGMRRRGQQRGCAATLVELREGGRRLEKMRSGWVGGEPRLAEC
jgi:hypothetical protein